MDVHPPILSKQCARDRRRLPLDFARILLTSPAFGSNELRRYAKRSESWA